MTNSEDYGWDILCKNKELCTAGWWLTFWSGAVNALTSFTVVFLRTTHMSGRVTDQARYLLTNPFMALLVSLALFSFVAGAFSGSKAMNYWGFTPCLLFPAMPMMAAAVLIYLGFTATGPQGVEGARLILGALLPFGFGWQNSITSKGRLGRTTHMSGELTDLGIVLAAGDWKRAGYLFTKYLGFLSGGMAGYLGSRHSPALVLALVSAGYAATVIVFHFRNAWTAETVPANVMAIANSGSWDKESNKIIL